MLTLHALPGSTRRGRRWVVDRGVDAGLPSATLRILELLSGELLANAVHHGPSGGAIDVTAGMEGDRFAVAVRDRSCVPPVVRHPGSDATGGRGMLLVESLAAAWGCTVSSPVSKSVWFTLSVAPT